MGTINYGTSKYITLGLNISDYDYDDEYAEYENSYSIQLAYEEAKSIVDDYNFQHFNVNLECGYYEGFYLDIQTDFDWCLNSWEDRKEYNKEITQIKELLIRLTYIGLVSVYPGWCTGYADEKQTKNDIVEAVRKMRQEVKELMTYNQWKRSGKTFQEMFC